MKKIQYSYFSTILALMCIYSAIGAQQANIQIMDATFSEPIIEVDGTSILSLTYRINGSATVPAYAIEIQISSPYFIYSSKENSPVGTHATTIDWTYKDEDYWQGVNRTQLSPNTMYQIQLEVTGIKATNILETTDILIRPIRHFGLFAGEQKSDNYTQASLMVVDDSNIIAKYRDKCHDALVIADEFDLQNMNNPLGVESRASIIASSLIKSNTAVQFNGRSSVKLTYPFKTETGVRFKAYTDGCDE